MSKECSQVSLARFASQKQFSLGNRGKTLPIAWLIAALISSFSSQAFSQFLYVISTQNQIILSWPASGTNQFYVQISTNIAMPNAWIDDAKTVYSDGTNYYTTNDIVGMSRFFRLEAWTILFNGTTTAAFRGYQQTSFPGTNSWIVDTNGELETIVGEPVNIITRNQYSDFELDWEWKASIGGNSGVNYRCTEEYPNSEDSGPEFQLLDDAHYSVPAVNTIGAVWDLIAPTNKVLVPTGQWNSCRLIVEGGNVQHWLNGDQVVGYNLNSSSFLNLVSTNPNFSQYSDYAQANPGYVAFRNDSTQTWFRNIKIRSLP